MTVEDLARQVIEMRKAQKKYFRDRGQGDLNESKRLERALDETCADLVREPSLFDQMEANHA